MKRFIQQYYTETRVYYNNGVVPSNCNSIIFVNTGTNPVSVDGLTLQPNQSFAITGNENEINTRSYDISFSGAGSNGLSVIKKIYSGAVDDYSYAQGRKPDPKNC